MRLGIRKNTDKRSQILFIENDKEWGTPIFRCVDRLNHILRNYDNMLKQRNIAEVQLAVANQNIERLLTELRKFDKERYPQSGK